MNMKGQLAAARDTLVKALTSPTSPPVIGVDLNGTIDENVWFFSFLANSWPGEIYVFACRRDRLKAVADLGKFGIKYTDVVLVNSFAEKTEAIARLGINVYFDGHEVLRPSDFPGLAIFRRLPLGQNSSPCGETNSTSGSGF